VTLPCVPAVPDVPARRWLPRPACLALALLASALLAATTASTTLASQRDAAVTAAYVQANYRLVQAVASRSHAIEGTLRGVLAQVRRECPLAAAGSPQDGQSTQLSNEVIGAMVIAVVALDRPAGRQFVSAAAHLSWSNRGLTVTVRAYVANVATLVALSPPRLCTDVQSWAASGFHTLPVSTIAFAPRFMSAWVAAGELPGALAPYETPAELPILRRTAQLESQLTDLEAREVETYGQIMNALDLSP
jgi:hypothetical protein